MPELRRPVLIASFRGWNDGGQGASLAGGVPRQAPGAPSSSPRSTPSASSTSRSTRPQVSLVEGRCAGSTGPRTPSTTRGSEHALADAVLLLGSEPSLRWRTFCSLVTGLALELGVELVVTLGSLLADVPHTRPAPVTASASDPSLIERLGAPAVALRGPDRHRRRPARRVPRGRHPVGVAVGGGAALRLADAPSPPAAKALCDRLATLLDVPIDTSELDEAASDVYVEQVSEAVAADEDTAAYVEELESRADELDDESDLPSGDALAAELTRFLREREQDEHGDDSVARDDGSPGSSRT